MRHALIGCLLLLAGPPAHAEEPLITPENALIHLVGRNGAPARAEVAEELAKRTDVSVDRWLEAMRAFGIFGRAASGHQTETIDLAYGGGSEEALYTTYVPSTYDPKKPAPLLMSFHGSGGDGRSAWQEWKATADELGMVVVCPGDTIGSGGFTWTVRERRAAWAALRRARRQFNVDESRIFAAGVSRGGHLVWDIALRRPDRFAALAPMIGGPRLNIARGQNNMRYLENLVDVAIRDLQGKRDDRFLVANLLLSFKALEGFGARDAKLVLFDDLGHSYDFSGVSWPAFLKSAKRPAVPQRVIRRCATLKEARAHWVEVLKLDRKVKEVFGLRVPREWNQMTPDMQRAFAAKEAEKRTARLEVEMEAPGVFVAKSTYVKRFRMLLTRDMVAEDGSVSIKFNKRRIKKRPKESKIVLLREFAERFDRRFLPTYEVVVP